MSKKVILALVVCVVGALMVPVGVEAQGGGPLPQSYGLQPYAGDGWTIMVPVNATIETISPTEIRILGPEVAIRPADMDFSIQGPAYQMDVVVYENPERVFPEVWAEQKILADWQEINAQGGPNTLPVTAEGQLDPAKFETPIVGNWPAAKAEFFGGDALVYHVYVGSGDVIVMFRYRAEFEMNNPIALMAQDVYALIMGTIDFAVD